MSEWLDVVCVGGPKDGDRIRIESGLPEGHRIVLPVLRAMEFLPHPPDPMLPDHMETAIYRVSRVFHGDNFKFSTMLAWEDIGGPAAIMETLLNGYRQPVPESPE